MRIALPTSISNTQYFVNQSYVKYILGAGFQPVLICPDMDVADTIASVDGLLLPGGIDIDPIYYGEDNYSSFSVDPAKDEFERNLLLAARTMEKPVFGICRGFQLIVREFQLSKEEEIGHCPGEFDQHIDYHNQTSEVGQGLARNRYQHFVNVNPNILYTKQSAHSKAITDQIPVNSMHHQGFIVNLHSTVKELRELGFHVIAYTKRGTAVKGGKIVCEATRITDWGSPILAVQWHPEELTDTALIKNFFNNHDAVSVFTGEDNVVQSHN